MLRDDLDNILIAINEGTLTADEFMLAESELPENYDTRDYYPALYSVLEKRNGVGTALKRLAAYFVSKGIIITDKERHFYNIFISADLG